MNEMVKECTCRVYDEVQKEKITTREAQEKLLKIIFLNQNEFYLNQFNDDTRSEILLYILEHVNTYLNIKFETKDGFYYYLIRVILNQAKDSFRYFFRQKASDASIEYYITSHEPESLVSEDSFFETLDNKREPSHYCKVKKIRVSAKQQILVIACKSSYFLTDSIISKVSLLTGKNIAELQDIFTSLKNTISTRAKLYNYRLERINIEYMLKNRSYLELQRLSPNTARYERIKRSYEFHLKRWKTSVNSKKDISYLCPTNKEISQILGIPPHQVYDILRMAKMPKYSHDYEKRLQSLYENLSSNRK
jgi:hypothetical protein